MTSAVAAFERLWREESPGQDRRWNWTDGAWTALALAGALIESILRPALSPATPDVWVGVGLLLTLSGRRYAPLAMVTIAFGSQIPRAARPKV